MKKSDKHARTGAEKVERIAGEMSELAVSFFSAFNIEIVPGWAKEGYLNKEGAFWVVHEGTLSVAMEDGSELSLGPGDMMFLSVPKCGRMAVAGRKKVRASTVHFFPSVMGSWQTFGRLGFPVMYKAREGAPWTWAARYLGDLHHAGPAGWRVEGSHLVTWILFYLVREYGERFEPSELRAGNPAWGRIAPALKVMGSRIADPTLTVADVAREAGLAPSRFREVFRRAVNDSPAHYIRALRVQEAKRYLTTTGLSCKEIAQRCGFASLAYFFRTFRQVSGKTPNRFRKVP